METMMATCLLALFVTRGLSSPSSTFFDGTATAIACSGSDVIFEEPAQSMICCASMCSQNKCCDGYFYTDTTGTCVGCKSQATSGDASLEERTVYSRKGGVQWEYFEGSYYTLNNSDLPYTEAKAYCQGLCSYPVHVNSQAEMDYLMTISKASWIGLERSEVTNEWFWGDDGSEVTFSNWIAGGNYMCSYYLFDGKRQDGAWFDLPCDLKRTVVCERK